MAGYDFAGVGIDFAGTVDPKALGHIAGEARSGIVGGHFETEVEEHFGMEDHFEIAVEDRFEIVEARSEIEGDYSGIEAVRSEIGVVVRSEIEAVVHSEIEAVGHSEIEAVRFGN